MVEGSGVKDAATLHGENASSATGTVNTTYSDDECKTLVKAAGEVTVSGTSVPASSEETLSAGTYYWQASYSGDTHNPACSDLYSATLARTSRLSILQERLQSVVSLPVLMRRD